MFEIIGSITKIFSTISGMSSRAEDVRSLSEMSTPIAERKVGFFRRLGNNITERRYKNPRLNRTLKATGTVLNTMISSKVSRNVGIVAAGFAFATSLAFPPVAIAFLSVSITGYVVKIASEVIQRRNLQKVQNEEKSLERIIKNKHRSIEKAHKLGITPQLAKQIGLSSLTLPDHNDQKLSKIDRDDLLRKKKSGQLSTAEKAQLAFLDKQIISSQKYAEKKSTFLSSATKTATSNTLEWIGDISNAAANLANPAALTIAATSAVVSFFSERKERHEASDQKQALKNSIELFRKRPDVPGYDNLAELQLYARQAKLEAKALEKLVDNQAFKDAKASNNVVLMTQLVKAAKHEVITESKALEESKELKKFKVEKKKAVENKIEPLLYNDYKKYEKRARVQLSKTFFSLPHQEQVLKAMKELAKIDAKEEVNRTNQVKETRLIDSIKTKSLSQQSRSPSNKSRDMIAEYERQDQMTTWQKTKKLLSDIGSSFNIFKENKLNVKKPHKLLAAEHLTQIAVHPQERVEKEHTISKAKEDFDKDKKKVMRIHQHLMEEALLSPYAVSVRKILPPCTPIVPHHQATMGVSH